LGTYRDGMNEEPKTPDRWAAEPYDWPQFWWTLLHIAPAGLLIGLLPDGQPWWKRVLLLFVVALAWNAALVAVRVALARLKDRHRSEDC
jgi:hypothetical protein